MRATLVGRRNATKSGEGSVGKEGRTRGWAAPAKKKMERKQGERRSRERDGKLRGRINGYLK